MSRGRHFSDLFYKRFFECIQAGRLYKIKSLFHTIPIDVNYKLPDGTFSLFIACQMPDSLHRSRTSIIKFLLKKGADPNLKTAGGYTPFSWACKHCKGDIIQLFLNVSILDIDLNTQDDNGDTPLMHATRSGNDFIVQKLIASLAQFQLSVDVSNYHDVTPYLEAKRLGLQRIESLLSVQGRASKTIQICPHMDQICHVDVNRSWDSNTYLSGNTGIVGSLLLALGNPPSPHHGLEPSELKTDLYTLDHKVYAVDTTKDFCKGRSGRKGEKLEMGVVKTLPCGTSGSTRQESLVRQSSDISNVNSLVKHLSRIEEEITKTDCNVKKKLAKSMDTATVATAAQDGAENVFMPEASRAISDLELIQSRYQDDPNAIYPTLTANDNRNSLEYGVGVENFRENQKMDPETNSRTKSFSRQETKNPIEGGSKLSGTTSARKGCLSRNSSRRRMLTRTNSSTTQSTGQLAERNEHLTDCETDTTPKEKGTGCKNYGSVIIQEDVFELCPDLRHNEQRSSSLDVRWMLALQAEQQAANYRIGTPSTYFHPIEKHDSNLSDNSLSSGVDNSLFIHRKAPPSSVNSVGKSKRKVSVVQRGLSFNSSFTN